MNLYQMTLIDSSEIYSAVVVVAILLVVLSVPSLLLNVRASSNLLKRYQILRAVGNDSKKDIPKPLLEEWSNVNTPLSYVSLLANEIEHISSLRPAAFQAEIAVVLVIILAFVPGFVTEVLVFMIAIVLVSVLTILYASMNANRYKREYMMALSELESNGDESADMIYG